jgi:hypothetical protein
MHIFTLLMKLKPVSIIFTFCIFLFNDPALSQAQNDNRYVEHVLPMEIDSFSESTNLIIHNKRLYIIPKYDFGQFITQPIAIPKEWRNHRTLIFPKFYETCEDQKIEVSYRLLNKNGLWSEWCTGTMDSHSLNYDEINGQDYYTQSLVPAVIEGSEISIQFKVKIESQECGIAGLKIFIIRSWEPAKTDVEFEYMNSLVCDCPELPFISRVGWSCPQGMGSSWNPTVTNFSHVVVHHAAGFGYTPLSAVHDIWELHALTQGWGDIGYNWLIDANGTIYQGRAWNGSNEQVIGAHMCGCNANKVGICLLGNLEQNQATPAQYNSLVALIGQKACMADITPDQSSFTSYNPYNNGCTSANLPNIIGHRDGCQQSPLYTSCPGGQFYPLLSQLRNDVVDYVTDCSISSGCASNDCCDFATNLQSTNSCIYVSGTVATATADYSWSPASCDGTSELRADVFYRFTAVESEHSITIDPTGDLDVVMSIYEGPNCYNLQEIDCMDTPGGNGVTTTMTTTGLTPGEIYFIRVYDYGNTNATSGGFNICVTHQNANGSGFDDVVPENFGILSNTIEAGGSISVYCDQAYNAGSSNSIDVNLGYFLSTDCTLNAGDIFLGSDSSNIGSSDISDSETADLLIPEETTTGDYFVLFVADYDDSIEETIENNNIECSIFSVINNSGSGNDDVVVENAMVEQNVVFAGGEVSISCDQAYNQGSSESIDVSIGFYLSIDCNYNPLVDIFLDDDISSIGSSDIYDTEIASPLIPIDIVPGVYYILCVADYNNLIAETNENNNIECIQITVSGLAPDFEITNLIITNSSICPEAIALEVSFDLLNIGGSGTINTLTQTGFWIIPQSDGCPQDFPFSNGIYTDDFNIFIDDMADDFEHVSSYLIIPVLPEGEYLLVAVADHNTDISEIDDVGNNIECTPLSINSNAIPPPAVIVGEQTICPGSSTILTIENFNELNAIYNYLWSTGNEEMSITVTTSGIYSVLAYGDGNCSEAVLTEIEVVLLNSDADLDGVPDCADDCPLIFGQVNDSCDDGNPNTINDNISLNCICLGTIQSNPGCVDPTACNYDNSANEDDGSCYYFNNSCDDGNELTQGDIINKECLCEGSIVLPFGCTNDLACNFDPEAVIDDGSCLLIGESCDDLNDETINDQINGACECVGELMSEVGCTNLIACNYDINATFDDGTCVFIGDPCDDFNNQTSNDTYNLNCICVGENSNVTLGCTDIEACNYDSTATLNDGSCLYGETGCTDVNACNFDPLAICDDNSCVNDLSASFVGELFFEVFPITSIYNCEFSLGSSYTWSISPEGVGSFLTNNIGPSIVNIQWNNSGLALLCVTETFVLDNGDTCIADPFCQEILLTTNMNESQIDEFLLYPNPTNGVFTIRPTKNSINTFIALFDITGRLIQTKPIYGPTELTLSGMAAGVYFVQITDGYSTYNYKIILDPKK